MSLKNDKFPSSEAFDALKAALADANTKKDLIKKGGAIFAFTLTNGEGASESWWADLKSAGEVGKGPSPEGKKADITLTLSEENFGKLLAGKANAQKLFMGGKLKVKGDVMKAAKAEAVLKAAAPKKAKL
ncbi:SCP2 sterol-binding domain-containing protein [Dipodascopsis tothii]|uniref:SCP2 sterol-binding domain-containing protein n=1 Tax=Dipodascopsis tothii TaxID=44089 RepID=UPI0034CDB59B